MIVAEKHVIETWRKLESSLCGGNSGAGIHMMILYDVLCAEKVCQSILYPHRESVCCMRHYERTREAVVFVRRRVENRESPGRSLGLDLFPGGARVIEHFSMEWSECCCCWI